MKTITIPDKAKPVFEKWFHDNYGNDDFENQFKDDIGEIFVPSVFLTLPESMQRGVFEDFLDEHGIVPVIDYNRIQEIFFYNISEKSGRLLDSSYYDFKTRPEASISANNKGLLILNDRL